MSNTKKPRTAEIARALAEPVLDALGLELWDLRFEKEGSDWYLRYFIDKPGGVTIVDCENFSRAVDKLLDEADPIEQSYVLEVSSPGIERELVKDWHFDRYIGSGVQVRLIRAVEGRRDFSGELLSKEGNEIRILLDGGVEMSFSKSEASSIKLAADYETGGQDE